MSQSKKPPELLALKDRGHQLIDELVRSGLARTTVYNRMRRKLDVPEKMAHFSQMNTIEEAQRGVDALQSWRDQRLQSLSTPANPPGHKKKYKRSQTLSYPEQQRAFAELRAHRERQAIPWYKRLLTWLRY